ncbi:MAG: Asp-tRNA(Asn)/Glu-tRNA(Gln) amidotransferase subunit GatB, partial [Bryobacteraceae bacterium]|nr:Asp-tRNA(Asn)/Glu-tRNA(Gln) amidotransferase subunit GatB [Bryobacteraceae bacterium]
AIALNCSVRTFSRFARKNYFYPDLPKGYQISQFDQPVAEHGYVDIVANGAPRRINLTRIHMEDDAGKSIHDGFRDSDTFSYVDLNRSGTPLIEIVTEPDMRSSDEAYDFLTAVKEVMQFVDVSPCDMEKGQLRCDANVSIRLRGAERLGTKVEVKNLNSFRFLKMALDYEVTRQIGIVDAGGNIVQETRLFSPETGHTANMRSKEEAHDYRYFQEPDLLPLRITEEWLLQVRQSLPELPASRRQRFVVDFGIRDYDAGVLTQSRATAEYFEQLAQACGDARMAANWVMGDLSALLKSDSGRDISDSPVSATRLGELLELVGKGEISGKLAKEIFAKMYVSTDSAAAIIQREGLSQISDSDALATLIGQVIIDNPKQVEQYRSGKTTVAGFLVGQVMKASKGQANPQLVNDLLRAKLGESN